MTTVAETVDQIHKIERARLEPKVRGAWYQIQRRISRLQVRKV